ncbi:Cytochrome C oxidase, cbb3-type, subunit III [Lysobacter sp. cf310]|nr:Cytochrome C oxidase, cbb3-type, subunit III [Lysobacter sp. cf310]
MSVRKARLVAAWHGGWRAGVLAIGLLMSACAEPPRTVVIIGGTASEGPGKHDYPQGVRKLQALIEATPQARASLRVVAYPDGWPQDPRALDGADTVVWYFDGLERHPLRDPQRRRHFETLMQRGVGLVALHQASTVPMGEDLGLSRWLGGAREGMFDRSTQWAELVPTAAGGTLSRGVAAFAYRDEFYPTFRFAPGGGKRIPVLKTTLHPQFRAGRPVMEDRAEDATVAWAFEREGGGRGFVYSGAHYLSALEQPQLATLLLNAIAWSAGAQLPRDGLRASGPRAETASADVVAAASPERAGFHIDAARSGWRRDERVLKPGNVDEAGFGEVWQSLPLDGEGGQPARLYASPLYLDRLTLTQGPLRGQSFPVVIAASNTGYVYAIAAAKRGDIAAGRILWRTRLGAPCHLQPAPLDGVATGILSTPVIDARRGRVYVTHCDPKARWQAYALDLGSGAVQPGWPVRLDEERLNAVNANAGPRRVPPKRRFDFRVQRGALNLSPDGGQLYVVFGESETGWLAAVDTRRAVVSSAFAAVAMPHRGSGGIWGAGGPAVDAEGRVYVVTGSGFEGYQDSAHDWTQSALQLTPPGERGFVLSGSYTPFNYCQSAKMDIDLGSGGAVLLPEAASGDARRLLALGGKQGNVYLLDRDRMPGRLDRRPPCSDDAAGDASLLPPQAQPQFGTRGPLNVFGPYSEQDAALDLARSRSLPATFRDRRGTDYLFVTGNSKRAPGSADSVPPSLVRVRVVRAAGRPPFLAIDRRETTLVLGNPGSPVVTSLGADHAIVWVLDENAPRSALLSGAGAPRPVLYALEAENLRLLWRSAPGELHTSGKYNEPAFGGGQVYVGTDRIQAFGLGGRRISRPAPVPPTVATVVPSAPSNALTGVAVEAIYGQRCAACHDHAVGNIPPREVIARHPRERIVYALSEGAMRPQAAGLGAEQIAQLADYLRRGRK